MPTLSDEIRRLQDLQTDLGQNHKSKIAEYTRMRDELGMTYIDGK